MLLQVPDLAEQRGQPGVLCPPRHQHLRVGVVEGAQFCEAPDEAGEVLGVLRVVDLRVLVEDAQERLLQLLDVPLVPQERAVCGAPGHSAVTGTQRPRARRGGGGRRDVAARAARAGGLSAYLRKTRLLLQAGRIRSQ